MGGFQLAPLDPLPQPETEKVQARPASLELTQPPAPSGNIGPGGQVANIAANFLQGWTMGTHITEQKKAQAMQQDINAAWLAYNIADQSGQRAMKDPSATDEQKKAIEHQRSQAWDHWVETHKKYATPEKGTKGKGGGKKEGGGIGGFLSQIFMPQAPHAGGATSVWDNLGKMGPPKLEGPSTQEQSAKVSLEKGQLELEHEKKLFTAEDKLVKVLNDPNATEEQKQQEQRNYAMVLDPSKYLTGQQAVPKVIFGKEGGEPLGVVFQGQEYIPGMKMPPPVQRIFDKTHDAWKSAEDKKDAKEKAKETEKDERDIRQYQRRLKIQANAFEQQNNKAAAKQVELGLDANMRYQEINSAVGPNGEGNSAADRALLYNFVGLTLSAQRGARVNNAIIEFELKQGNLNERAQAWWGSLTKGEAFAPDVRLRIKQEAKIIRDLALQRAQQGMQAYGGTRAFPTLQDEEGDRVTVTFPGNPTPQTIPRSALDEAKSKYKAVEVGQPQPLSPPPR